jgi:hypothetical protein
MPHGCPKRGSGCLFGVRQATQALDNLRRQCLAPLPQKNLAHDNLYRLHGHRHACRPASGLRGPYRRCRRIRPLLNDLIQAVLPSIYPMLKAISR